MVFACRQKMTRHGCGRVLSSPLAFSQGGCCIFWPHNKLPSQDSFGGFVASGTQEDGLLHGMRPESALSARAAKPRQTACSFATQALPTYARDHWSMASVPSACADATLSQTCMALFRLVSGSVPSGPCGGVIGRSGAKGRRVWRLWGCRVRLNDLCLHGRLVRAGDVCFWTRGASNVRVAAHTLYHHMLSSLACPATAHAAACWIDFELRAAAAHVQGGLAASIGCVSAKAFSFLHAGNPL